MTFNKKAYDQQYIKKNVIRKEIVFNRNNPQDMKTLEYINGKESANAYIKELINQDMQKKPAD